MTEHCSKCGEPLKEEALFCANCGAKVPNRRKFSNRLPILIIIVVIALAVLAATIFLTNQTQTVRVDNVEFELPDDYVNEPLRTDVNYDKNVKSSSMGWSNDKHYIEIGVSRTPGEGVDSERVAAGLGGSPSKMFGYSGYLIEYENKDCAFVFGMTDEVVMVYVSDYDAFDDVKVIGRV